jgi:TM2 domain-containing membrane protein YozV
MNCANHPDSERVAFCQNCGKPLCRECVKTVGTSVFCEPCLVARVGAGPIGAGAGPVGTAGGYTYVNRNYTGVVPPLTPGEPSPGLAALLGFIPGVGAMYNEQYAKGIVHLIVFAVLVSLSHEIGIFHLFAFGWVIYQVIDAHHTARARRDGTPLPDPFGLNDVGERLGFGRAWAAGAPPVGTAPGSGTPYPPPDTASFTADPAGNVSYTGSGGTQFGQTPAGSQTYSQPYGQPYAPPVAGWGAPQDTYGYGAPPVPPIPPAPPIPPYPVPPYPDPNLAYQPPFPAGAIWLIGLGVLFLFGNIGIFHFFFFRARVFWPLVLIGIGVWVFIRRMTCTGAGVADDGSPDDGWRLARAVRSSMWIVLTGILWLLSSLDILSWEHSWPLYLIAGGLTLFFRRTMFGGYGPGSYGPGGGGAYPGYPYPPPTVPPAPSATTTAIVPTSTHDEHGDHSAQGGR